jgi:hypothetical protein
MEEIKNPDKQKPCSDEQEIVIVKHLPRVPGEHKDAEDDDNSEQVSETMKQEVTVKAGKVQTRQY